MKNHRFFYGWIIVGIAFVTLSISFGVWYSFSVFFVAIIKEFGWSRAGTAGVFSLFMVVQSSAAVFIGHLVDSYGPRKVMLFGSILIVVGLVATSRINSLLQFYLSFGIITAIGICSIGYTSHSVFLPNWFVKKRGLAIGIATAGIGIGMQILVPFSQNIISHYGWRYAYLVLATIVLVIVIPLNTLFQRKNPEEVGAQPDGEKKLETYQRDQTSLISFESTNIDQTFGSALKPANIGFLLSQFFSSPWLFKGR